MSGNDPTVHSSTKSSGLLMGFDLEMLKRTVEREEEEKKQDAVKEGELKKEFVAPDKSTPETPSEPSSNDDAPEDEPTPEATEAETEQESSADDDAPDVNQPGLSEDDMNEIWGDK